MKSKRLAKQQALKELDIFQDFFEEQENNRRCGFSWHKVVEGAVLDLSPVRACDPNDKKESAGGFNPL